MTESLAPASAWSQRLCELVARARERARASGRRVLVSVVEEVASADPLAALEAGRNRSDEPRMYWARPSEQASFATQGVAVTIEPAGASRFREADAAWRQLLADALVHDPSGGAEGAGPMLVGGLAFSTANPRAAYWTDFPDTGLWVPRIQLASTRGRHWLTATLVVGAGGEPDIGPDALERRRRELTTGAGTNGAARPVPDSGRPAVTFRDEQPAQEWRTLVADAVADIRTGPLEKVVLARARHASAAIPIDPVRVLALLRDQHPGCMIFGCWRGSSVFLGASPERLVRLVGREVEASSLAGSAPRGATAEMDRAFAVALAASAKDRSEHALVRNALIGALVELCAGVEADEVPSLLTLPHVHHLHTAVRARLDAGRTLIDLVEALHPTPAVGGVPRAAALEYIGNHEGDRGWYAAPVGWIGRDRGEFAVALRSALIRGRDAWLFAGCGIVAGSDPTAEYAETLLKLRPMEDAIASAGGEAA